VAGADPAELLAELRGERGDVELLRRRIPCICGLFGRWHRHRAIVPAPADTRLHGVVGISLLTLVPGIVGGSETYARELVAALGRVGGLSYRVYVPTVAPDAGGPLPSRVVEGYRAGTTTPARVAAMARGAVSRRVRRELELDRLDALHFPLSVMIPRVERPPAATTILDLQHEFLPEFFSRPELLYRRVVYGRTARASRRVITISEHARETIVERLGLPPGRVRAIHLGVDLERFSPGPEPRGDFLLYPANRWPHKNHERLFAAVERLGRPLVLTGSGHEGHPAPPFAEVRGRVPPDELVRLLRTAAALVFPSLYEGFGQPPLEALACATPVAVSDLPPLREVCGDAAAYFDPLDPESIAAGIEEALRRGGAAGPTRAAGFTWDACARAHDEVYRELAAEA
jgi:glycosyltransferase involved in cell wall biosynthesis